MVDPALDAADLLKKDGISTQVIDMHTIKPLDTVLLKKCIQKKSVLLTAEEHSVIGGLGGAVAEFIAEQRSCLPFRRIGIKDRFCESGPPAELWEKYKLNAKYQATIIKQLLKQK